MGRTKIWSWVLMRPEAKFHSPDEDQQQFTEPDLEPRASVVGLHEEVPIIIITQD